jgi:hypothetical protein
MEGDESVKQFDRELEVLLMQMCPIGRCEIKASISVDSTHPHHRIRLEFRQHIYLYPGEPT